MPYINWIKVGHASSSRSDDKPDDGDDDNVSVVSSVVHVAAATDDKGLWRRMCPPSACPVGNVWPHVPHRCCTGPLALPGRAPSRRSRPWARTRGRLWLVRWPPSAWKVANRRPHVRHSNAPPCWACSCTRSFLLHLVITLLAAAGDDSASSS
jgi:hypothetical protein